MIAAPTSLLSRLAPGLDALADPDATLPSLLERARAWMDEGRVDEAGLVAQEALIRARAERSPRLLKLRMELMALLAEFFVRRGSVRLAVHFAAGALDGKQLKGLARLRCTLALMQAYARAPGMEEDVARARRAASASATRLKATRRLEVALAALELPETPAPEGLLVPFAYGGTATLIDVWPRLLGAPEPALKQAIYSGDSGDSGDSGLTPAQLAAAVVDTPRALPRLGRSYLHSGWLHALARLYADAPADRRRELAEALARRCLESEVHDAHLCLLAVYALARTLERDEELAPEFDLLVWRGLSEEFARVDRGGSSEAALDPSTGEYRIVAYSPNYEHWIHRVAVHLPRERLEAVVCHGDSVVSQRGSGWGVRGAWCLLGWVDSERVARRAVELVDAWSYSVDEAYARRLLWRLREHVLAPLTELARARRRRGELTDVLESTLEALDGPEVLAFWAAEFGAPGKAPPSALDPAIGARVVALCDDEAAALPMIEGLFASKRWGRRGRELAIAALAGRPCTPATRALARRLAGARKLDAASRAALEGLARRLPNRPRYAATDGEAAGAHITALIEREVGDASLARRATQESWVELVNVIELCDASLRPSLLAQARRELAAWPTDVRVLTKGMAQLLLDGEPLRSAPLVRDAELSLGFADADVDRWRAWIDQGLFAELEHLSLSGLALDAAVVEALADAGVFRGVERLDLSRAFAASSAAPRLLRAGELDGCRELTIDLEGGPAGEELLAAIAASAASLVSLTLIGRRGVELDASALDGLLAARPLEGLSLREVRLARGACARLAACESLRSLTLAGCGLDDGEVAALCAGAGLTGLERLDLAGNPELSGASLVAITAASGLVGLRALGLGATDLGVDDLERWAAAPGRRAELRELDLSWCRLEEEGARVLFASAWPALEVLGLDRTWLGDGGLQALAEAPGAMPLAILMLADCGLRVEDPGFAALMGSAHVARLRRLDLSANNLEFSDALGELGGSPLEELYLGGAHIHGSYKGVVAALGGTVHTLEVHETGLGTEGVCAIASSPTSAALRRLYLDSYDLSRRALRFLASSPWLDEETKETWRRTLRWCEANGATARYPAFELWP